MNIARGCKLAGLICLLGITVLIACVVKLCLSSGELEKASNQRYESTLLAQEVRVLSDGLTVNARAYVTPVMNVLKRSIGVWPIFRLVLLIAPKTV